MDIRRAAGTNLVVGFVLGVAGFATHAAEGESTGRYSPRAWQARFPAAGWARATGRVPENTLRLALGVVLVVVGLAFAVQALV